MPFETTCPHCGRVHTDMPDSASGAMVRCRECFKPFTALAIAPVTAPPGEAASAPVKKGEPVAAQPEMGLTGAGVDLRPVITRLLEIQRKCGVLSAEHAEVQELVPVLESLIRTLRLGHGPRGEALVFREVVAPVGPWARRLERLGIPTLAREVAHVERALAAADDAVAARRKTDAAPPRESERTEAAPAPPAVRPVEEALRPAVPLRQRRGLPATLLAVTALGVAALVAALLLVRAAGQVTVARTLPVPTSVGVRPTSRPRLSPTPVAEAVAGRELSPGAVRELADAVSQARLALQRSDTDAAIAQLSRAAQIDRGRPEVRGAAQEVVKGLIARSAQQFELQDWDGAQVTLQRALELSQRFVLDAATVEDRLQRLRTAERTVRIRPTELDRLRTAVGRQVEVRLKDRDVLRAALSAVEGQVLLLEMRDQVKVGAGEVTYTKRVPLATVEWVEYRYRP